MMDQFHRLPLTVSFVPVNSVPPRGRRVHINPLKRKTFSLSHRVTGSPCSFQISFLTPLGIPDPLNSFFPHHHLRKLALSFHHSSLFV